MGSSHAALALPALLLTLSSPAPAQAGDGSSDPSPPAALPQGGEQPAAAPNTLAVVDGVVRAVDLAGHRVTLDVGGSVVLLELDRNTLVYLPTGLSTVFELRPGEIVRAGRSDRLVAFWIQVRSAPSGPGKSPSTPGQGTGPGGGTPAPPERGSTPPAPAERLPAASSPGTGVKRAVAFP